MYKYINPNNKHLTELLEFGEDMILQIVDMMPEQYEEYVELIKNGIVNRKYSEIARGVHTIKANLRYFMGVDNPIIEFCQDFENRAKEKSDEFKMKGNDIQHIDFATDFQKLLEITEEPLQEIQLYGFELREKIGD